MREVPNGVEEWSLSVWELPPNVQDGFVKAGLEKWVKARL